MLIRTGDTVEVIAGNDRGQKSKVLKVDRSTGNAREVDLGGASLTHGDGLEIDGDILYVVRNQNNLVAVVALSADLLSGRVVDEITSPAFDVPTTIARLGNRLYLPNARFTTPPTPTTAYSLVAVDRR